MFKKISILFILMIVTSACIFAEQNNYYQIKKWKIVEDETMQDLGVNMLGIDHIDDKSHIGIVEKQGITKAISAIGPDQNSRVGIQYSQNNEIEYLKISNYYKSGKYDHSFLKLQKVNGNWILTEYKDNSEKEILRSVELK